MRRLRLLAPLLLLASLATPSLAGPSPSCAPPGDPTARCGQELARGSAYDSTGTGVVAGSNVIFVGYAGRSTTLAGFDSRTSARRYAVSHFLTAGYPHWGTLAAAGPDRVVAAGSVLGLSGGYAELVAGFDARTGRQLWQRLTTPKGHARYALAAADARRAYVVTGGSDSTGATWYWDVTALDARTGAVEWVRSVPHKAGLDPYPLAVAVSGDRVVVVGDENDSSCYHARVDVLTTSGRLLAVQRHVDDAGGCSNVQAVSVSPDGRYAAAVGYGGTALTEADTMVVDLRTGRQRWWGASQGLGLGAAGFAVTWHGTQVLVGESAYVSPVNAFLPDVAPAYGGTFLALPRVVAYDGAKGTQLWSTVAAPTSTRLGALFGLAVSADGKVLYETGEEGTSLGFADAYVSGSSENPVGYADGFVRAIDLETHQELWTGRLPTDAHEAGVNGSAFLTGLPVPGGVVVVGRTTLTEWTSNAGRHNYTRGVLLRFDG